MEKGRVSANFTVLSPHLPPPRGTLVVFYAWSSSGSGFVISHADQHGDDDQIVPLANAALKSARSSTQFPICLTGRLPYLSVLTVAMHSDLNSLTTRYAVNS